MGTLQQKPSAPQDPLERGERIRTALRCGRAGCLCSKPGPRGVSHCPSHDDARPSLSVDVRDGRVLVRCHAGCPQDRVLEELRRRGLWLASRMAAGESVYRTRYELRDPDGGLLAVHMREDQPGGRKRFWWERPDGTRGLDGMRPTDLLFGLEHLPHHPGELAIVCEGERAASALLQSGLLAVGTVCGAAATPSEDVLRHLLDRPVVLWPDADEPGRRHMLRVAEALHRLGHRDVRMVEPPPGVRAGWDAADALVEGMDVRALVAAARPVRPLGHAPALLTAAEILQAADSPEPDWLVEGLIPAGGVTLLVGRPKSGKSTFARALAVAVAQGRPFLGRETRRGPVLLLSLEDRQRDAARHLRALGLRAEDPLLLAAGQRDIQPLRCWIQAYRPVLVVIDTVGRVLHLRDSSEYAEVTEALDGLLRLARESGAAFLLVHHSPKASDGRDPIDAPLGSTAFAGTADVVLHLKRGRDGVRTLASVQRVGQDMEESVVTIGPDGWPALVGTRREVQTQAMSDEILKYLASHGESTRDEILSGVQGEAAVKIRALDHLVREGRVVRSGTGRRGDPFRFRLAPRGVDPRGDPLPSGSPDSVFPFADSPANGRTETKNWLDPASLLDESRSADLEVCGGPANGVRTESPPRSPHSPEGPEALPGWAVGLAEGLPRQPGTDPEAVARVVETLLELPKAPSPDHQGPPDRPCRSCGGRRWWMRPKTHGGGWVCARCHPPGPVEPAATQAEEAHGGPGASEVPQTVELSEGQPQRPELNPVAARYPTQNAGVPQRVRQSGATNPPLLRGPEIRMVRDPLACRRGLQRIVRVRGRFSE
jgi:hypothetical protein